MGEAMARFFLCFFYRTARPLPSLWSCRARRYRIGYTHPSFLAVNGWQNLLSLDWHGLSVFHRDTAALLIGQLTYANRVAGGMCSRLDGGGGRGGALAQYSGGGEACV